MSNYISSWQRIKEIKAYGIVSINGQKYGSKGATLNLTFPNGLQSSSVSATGKPYIPPHGGSVPTEDNYGYCSGISQVTIY